MPLDVPGRTRATMIIAVSISLSIYKHRKRESSCSMFSNVASVVVSLRAVKPALKV